MSEARGKGTDLNNNPKKMGNNANSLPSRTASNYGAVFPNVDHESASGHRCVSTNRGEAFRDENKSGTEAVERCEKSFGTLRHFDECRSSGNPRSHYTVRERHETWTPKSSPQNLPGGNTLLLCQPTIEIQPLTSEMLMNELPSLKTSLSTCLGFGQKVSPEDLPGLSKPYRRFAKTEKSLITEVRDRINETISPVLTKENLPGLRKPFSDFANEKKMTEVWPSLKSTCHFEQYLPKEKRKPEMIAKVEDNLTNEIRRNSIKRLIKNKSVEEYLAELEKDLIEMTEKQSEPTPNFESEKLDIELIKSDLENDPPRDKNDGEKLVEEDTTEIPTYVIAEETQMEANETKSVENVPDIQQTDSLDSLHELSTDFDNSLDRIPDFKDDTVATDNDTPGEGSPESPKEEQVEKISDSKAEHGYAQVSHLNFGEKLIEGHIQKPRRKLKEEHSDRSEMWPSVLDYYEDRSKKDDRKQMDWERLENLKRANMKQNLGGQERHNEGR